MLRYTYRDEVPFRHKSLSNDSARQIRKSTCGKMLTAGGPRGRLHTCTSLSTFKYILILEILQDQLHKFNSSKNNFQNYKIMINKHVWCFGYMLVITVLDSEMWWAKTWFQLSWKPLNICERDWGEETGCRDVLDGSPKWGHLKHKQVTPS